MRLCVPLLLCLAAALSSAFVMSSPILKKFDIIPSEKYYSNADVQILGQIEICFDQDFTLLDCERHFTMETISKGDWDKPVNRSIRFQCV
ncbi:Ribonuclease T2 [Collichthys lucidus]|uniref:Ribonuclease T2 n=1 Tax=Collichthys lucidus TaxID=240159 RepID=A0A4U5U787_COLLU|nr:Ribonuclease T2 [Collichthys lucidus]